MVPPSFPWWQGPLTLRFVAFWDLRLCANVLRILGCSFFNGLLLFSECV